MPRPLFTPGKDELSIVQEAGWALGPVWTGAENLAPTRIRSSDRPPRTQSLYRLCYLAHRKSSWHPLNRRLGAAQSWSGCYSEEKHHLPLPGTEPQFLRFPVTGCVIIPTMLPALTHFDKRTVMTASNRMTKQRERTVSLLTT